MEFLGYAIAAFLAFFIGVLANRHLTKTVGTLIVDRTDRDDPYLYLQLDDPDWYKVLANHDNAIFRIKFKE